MSGIHQLKWIPWGDEFAPIVTQNENGPCPLLALCNVLILSKRMEVTPGETALTSQQLLDMLGSCLIESTPKVVHVSSQLTYVVITMCVMCMYWSVKLDPFLARPERGGARVQNETGLAQVTAEHPLYLVPYRKYK